MKSSHVEKAGIAGLLLWISLGSVIGVEYAYAHEVPEYGIMYGIVGACLHLAVALVIAHAMVNTPRPRRLMDVI